MNRRWMELGGSLLVISAGISLMITAKNVTAFSCGIGMAGFGLYLLGNFGL